MPSSPFSALRFRSALRFFLVGRAAQALATVALTLATVRLLDQSDYGAYMLVWGLVEFAMPVTSLGLLPAAQRYLPDLAVQGSVGEVRRLVRTLSLARGGLVLLACVALALSWQLSFAWMQLPVAGPHLAALVAGLVGTQVMLRFAAEMLESLLEQAHAQSLRALVALGRLAAVAGLWWTDTLSLLNLLVAELLISVTLWFLGEWWLRQRLRRLEPAGDRMLDRFEFWTFVWHMAGVQLLSAAANDGLLRIAVARALGLEAAGHFAFLQQMLAIAQRYMPSTLLANLVRPMLISRHADARHGEVAVAFGFLWKVNLMIAWPLLPAALLGGTALIHSLSGGRVQDAGLALAMMMLALAATAQNQIVVMSMQVYRYTVLARRVSVLALAAPPFVWVGASHGIVGAAGGLAAALMLRASVGLWTLRRQPLGADLDWVGAGRFCAVLLLGTGAAWAAASWVGNPGAAALLLGLVAMGTRLMPPLRRAEFELVERALGRRARPLSGWVRG